MNNNGQTGRSCRREGCGWVHCDDDRRKSSHAHSQPVFLCNSVAYALEFFLCAVYRYAGERIGTTDIFLSFFPALFLRLQRWLKRRLAATTCNISRVMEQFLCLCCYTLSDRFVPAIVNTHRDGKTARTGFTTGYWGLEYFGNIGERCLE